MLLQSLPVVYPGLVPVKMAPLSVVILLMYVVVKCIVLAAVPIDPTKIDFEKGKKLQQLL